MALHWRMPVTLQCSAVKQAAGSVFVQGEDMLRPRLEGDLADPTKIGATAHHHGRLCIANEVFDFSTLISGVQGQEHITRTQSGQVQNQGFDGLFDLHSHPAALWQVKGLKQVGHHRGGPLQIQPTVFKTFIGLNRHPFHIGWKRGPEGRKQIVLGHGGKNQT